jgi:hypothetical protein
VFLGEAVEAALVEVQVNLADGEDVAETMEVILGRNCFCDASLFRSSTHSTGGVDQTIIIGIRL